MNDATTPTLDVPTADEIRANNVAYLLRDSTRMLVAASERLAKTIANRKAAR